MSQSKAARAVKLANDEQAWAAEATAARLGFALLDLKTNEFVWGTWNDRSITPAWVKELVADFKQNGMPYLLVEVAMPCIVKRSDIDPTCLVDDKGIRNGMPYIKFASAQPPAIKAAGGHHRYVAWKRLHEMLVADATRLDTAIKKLSELDTLTEEQTLTLSATQKEKEDNDILLGAMHGWLGVFYDEGEYGRSYYVQFI